MNVWLSSFTLFLSAISIHGQLENHICQPLKENAVSSASMCWPLKSNTKCNWCVKECIPDSVGFPICKPNETCCLHECGTTCLPTKEVGQSPKGSVCKVTKPRVGCPAVQKQSRCSTCENKCEVDEDCKSVGGGGRLCCSTNCGKRCLETIIF